jgi:hypothetical protein
MLGCVYLYFSLNPPNRCAENIGLSRFVADSLPNCSIAFRVLLPFSKRASVSRSNRKAVSDVNVPQNLFFQSAFTM